MCALKTPKALGAWGGNMLVAVAALRLGASIAVLVVAERHLFMVFVPLVVGVVLPVVRRGRGTDTRQDQDD